jgi:molybdopterin-biosynthesis enzyme MoeA-like protein
MPKPHQGFMPPGFPGQIKTMFYNEGNPVATLVTNKAGKHSERIMKFGTAEAALGWCLDHGVNLFYMPVRLEAN